MSVSPSSHGVLKGRRTVPVDGLDADRINPWPRLLRALTVSRPADLAPLSQAVRKWLDAGGDFFESVVGTPHEHYGPRLTLTVHGGVAAGVLGGHPWGPQTWLGLRVGAAGVVVYNEDHC